jgi:tetrapyrrole methylase family protein / MazG family protein
MTETAGGRFDRLVQVMRTLRSPHGCPWDREQTLSSLRPFVLEETYELLDALDRGDVDALKEELGDFL